MRRQPVRRGCSYRHQPPAPNAVRLRTNRPEPPSPVPLAGSGQEGSDRLTLAEQFVGGHLDALPGELAVGEALGHRP